MTDLAKEGFRLYKLKDYGGALSVLLSVPAKETEGDLDIAYLTGLCLARMDRREEAVAYLERVVDADGDFARVYQCRMTLAVLYARMGRTSLAAFELKKLNRLGYESAQVFSALGFISHEAGDADKSLEWYEKALKMDEKNATALNGLGYILAEEGRDLTRALSLCEMAIDESPENPAYLDSLAWAHYKLGHNEEARDCIRQAREKLPDNETVMEHFRKISNG